jgi:hypothetical protein
MAREDRQIEGVVLCRVGSNRLGVLASDVGALESPEETAEYAGVAFGMPRGWPDSARQLRSDSGMLIVDSVEVSSESLSMFAVPSVISSSCGGALRGFVSITGLLWPIVHLGAFSRFLEAKK